jgi:NAD(P)-dependent dehydrogenase (short-subunit alcohol dehydrogenase family)
LPKDNTTSKAVVLTGASTGIGAATAELLAKNGFVVFAGVRNDTDASRLAALHPNIRPLHIDVTKATSIDAAANGVGSSGITLYGLVNNAGIALGGPLEILPIDELRRQFEVNLFGAVAVTQRFLPLLRTGHPERSGTTRLVFVGSISGRLAVPYIAPYCASKFALRAVADALRVELAPVHVAVSLIEPGSVKTPIWAKGREIATTATIPPDAPPHYHEAIAQVVHQTQLEERNGMPVERVSEAILHALTAPKPRPYYLLGAPARMGNILAKYLPPNLRDTLVRRNMRLP